MSQKKVEGERGEGRVAGEIYSTLKIIKRRAPKRSMKTLPEKLGVLFSTCPTEAYQRCFLRFVSMSPYRLLLVAAQCVQRTQAQSLHVLSDVLPMSSCRRCLPHQFGSWSPVSEMQCADTAHKTPALLQWQASEGGHVSPFYREVS